MPENIFIENIKHLKKEASQLYSSWVQILDWASPQELKSKHFTPNHLYFLIIFSVQNKVVISESPRIMGVTWISLLGGIYILSYTKAKQSDKQATVQTVA